MASAPPASRRLARPTSTRFEHHWQDEADAAFLYRLLSDAEPDREEEGSVSPARRGRGPARRGVGRAAAPARPRPGRVHAERAHAAARRCSEGCSGRASSCRCCSPRKGARSRGISTCIGARRSGAPGADESLTLARESAEHATTLNEISGKTGEPWHRTESGGFLRNVVYGFNDGLTANFGLVAGVIGASASSRASHGDRRRRRRPHRRRAVDGIERLSRREERAGSVRERDRDGARRDRAHAGNRARRAGADLRGEGHDARSRRTRWRRKSWPIRQRMLEEQVQEELGIGEPHMSPLREGWVTGTATAIGALIPGVSISRMVGRDGDRRRRSSSRWRRTGSWARRARCSPDAACSAPGLDMFVVGLGVAVVGYFVGERVAEMIG